MLLKQVNDGVCVKEVCCEARTSQQTYNWWRTNYGGLTPSEVRRLNHLEEENRCLKQMVANCPLDKAALQDVLTKSSEACAGAAAGGWSAGYVPGVDPVGLSRTAVPEILVLLPLAPAVAGCFDQTHPGDRRDPCPSRLSAH